MAFYTAEWVRKLVKEDHVALQKHISKKDNDFRSYIDSTLPFTLYLDIDNIRKSILTPNSKFILGITAALNLTDANFILKELDTAYQKTINYYIDSYTSISSEELSDKLNLLKASYEEGNIKSTLQTLFKNTVVISNLSKRNKSVLILSPKFTTIQSKFGSVVKDNFDLSNFSDLIDDVLEDSPKNIMQKYLNKNFAVLNNLGHVEVDVISSATGSTEVKRGMVSPRLLQALIEWPKESKIESLVRKFSKDTGQAETRVKVRKQFSNSKLVLEMLIEAGIMIGSVESQEENLRKAPKEKAFIIGQGLTAKIRANPSLLINLETSKSISKFLVDSLLQTIKGNKPSEYRSSTIITTKTPIIKQRVSVSTKQKSSSTTTKLPTLSLRTFSGQFYSLASLQLLINENLQNVISANMGDGSRKDTLNYRTGRFAASAAVERMSQSREGMITAFYTYMKYPYQTFEPGYVQGSPKTRDPKLLIAKSIREIAATKVGNRLRAVSV